MFSCGLVRPFAYLSSSAYTHTHAHPFVYDYTSVQTYIYIKTTQQQRYPREVLQFLLISRGHFDNTTLISYLDIKISLATRSDIKRSLNIVPSPGCLTVELLTTELMIHILGLKDLHTRNIL